MVWRDVRVPLSIVIPVPFELLSIRPLPDNPPCAWKKSVGYLLSAPIIAIEASWPLLLFWNIATFEVPAEGVPCPDDFWINNLLLPVMSLVTSKEPVIAESPFLCPVNLKVSVVPTADDAVV